MFSVILFEQDNNDVDYNIFHKTKDFFLFI